MLVTFSSKNVAGVLMLSEHAIPLLKAAGKPIDGAIPERGVFTPEQLDAAITGLEQAIASAAPLAHDEDDDEDRDEPPVHAMARPVGLAQRAYPLLDMFRRARDTQDDVMWEASRGF